MHHQYKWNMIEYLCEKMENKTAAVLAVQTEWMRIFWSHLPVEHQHTYSKPLIYFKNYLSRTHICVQAIAVSVPHVVSLCFCPEVMISLWGIRLLSTINEHLN